MVWEENWNLSDRTDVCPALFRAAPVLTGLPTEPKRIGYGPCPPNTNLPNDIYLLVSILRRSSAADMAGLMVSAASMAMDLAASPARAVAVRSIPSR